MSSPFFCFCHCHFAYLPVSVQRTKVFHWQNHTISFAAWMSFAAHPLVGQGRFPACGTSFWHSLWQRISLADLFFFFLWHIPPLFICCIMLWQLLCPVISTGNFSVAWQAQKAAACWKKQTKLSHALWTLSFMTCKCLPWMQGLSWLQNKPP